MEETSTETALKQLRLENEQLQKKLAETETMLHATRSVETGADEASTAEGINLSSTSDANTKKMDQKLKTIEEKYRDLLNNLNAGVVVHAPDTSITYSNPKAAQLLGLSQDQMEGRVAMDPEWKFFDINSQPLPFNLYPVNQVIASNQEIKNFIAAIKQPITHNMIWLNVNGVPILNNEGKIVEIIISFIDITERKNAEQQLKESERKFRLIAENTLDGVAVFDSDRKAQYLSPAYLKQLGLTEADVLKHSADSIYNMIHPDDRDAVISSINKAIESKKNGMIYSYRAIHADGHYIWREDNASFKYDEEEKFNGAYVICRDVSERKQAEEALKESEEKYRMLSENFAGGISLFENDKVKYISEGYLNTLGYQSNELKEISYESILSFIHQEDVERIRKTIKTAYQQQTKLLQYSYRIKTKQGKYIWMEDIAKLEYDQAGHHFRSIIYSRDITERKESETKIEELNRDLDKKVMERTAQYEMVYKELESFTYSVSHDLRAPLRAINAYTQILSEDYGNKLDEDGKLVIDNIKKNGQKMGRLIDDLLSFSRLGRKELKKDAVNMNELTKSVLSELNQNYPNHAEIQVSDLPVVQGDYSLLYQVMFNLIGNAIKYSSKKEKPVINVYMEQKEGKNTFVIKDNGAGFDMRFVDKLFGVFQRLHSQQEFEGNGVGLAIVQRIISKHGGKVWGEGKENEGATFYFTVS